MTIAPVSREATRRYAKALLNQAEAESRLNEVARALHDLRRMLDESLPLLYAFTAPAFNMAEKSKLILNLTGKMDLPDLVRRFLQLLNQSSRLGDLVEIIRMFELQASLRRGDLLVKVITAKPLASDQLAALMPALQAKFSGQVIVDFVVDSSIYGGLVVSVGSRLYDYSLSDKINRLEWVMRRLN